MDDCLLLLLLLVVGALLLLGRVLQHEDLAGLHRPIHAVGQHDFASLLGAIILGVQALVATMGPLQHALVTISQLEHLIYGRLVAWHHLQVVETPLFHAQALAGSVVQLDGAGASRRQLEARVRVPAWRKGEVRASILRAGQADIPDLLEAQDAHAAVRGRRPAAEARRDRRRRMPDRCLAAALVPPREVIFRVARPGLLFTALVPHPIRTSSWEAGHLVVHLHLVHIALRTGRAYGEAAMDQGRQDERYAQKDQGGFRRGLQVARGLVRQ
mmetsp:Transcript_182139/g.443238  ORF Transcript_182139/g.443238 Transcript_182139/m.443238 type:complete len:271 (+) Transcript_182139:900-1712(+)